MSKEKSVKRKLRKDGDFIPPDGGWGWMIVVAAGLSNLVVLPMMQQFGLLFRDRVQRLGMTSSETTTIINTNAAMTACVGLANGPLFKTFSYRIVSLTGATVIFIALMMTTYSNNFTTLLISYSLLYGVGYGVLSSANALALNTYWKKRRRLATSFSWTTTGLGPIFWPHVITALFIALSETHALLVMSLFSLIAIGCSLLLDPVEKHAKVPEIKNPEEETILEKDPRNGHTNNDIKSKENKYFRQVSSIKNLSRYSSQYLYNEDDPVNTGYEIIDPGTPMMLRANDGYFSQVKTSKNPSNLTSKVPSVTNLLENRSKKTSTLYLNESKKNSSANLGSLSQDRDYKPKRRTSTTIDTRIPESELEDCVTLKAPQILEEEKKVSVEDVDPEKVKSIDKEKRLGGSKSLNSFNIDCQYGEKYTKDNHSNVSLKNQDDGDDKKYSKDNHTNQHSRTRLRTKSNNFNYENEVLKQASLKLEEYVQDNENSNDRRNGIIHSLSENNDDDEAEEVEEKLSFLQKVLIFFDLDLLKDFTFINLMLGITLATFNELNFSILTPFIFADYGMSKSDVALFMSLLAGVDICVRFCIPFVAGKIGWDNNSFYLFGVLIMSLGRVVLAFSQEYSVVMAVAVVIGFGKGLRTVFMALVIPTYVPLHKLPGATGIQLVAAGIVYTSFGPVVGWIKDNASTAVLLFSLNIFTWLTALSWLTEKYIMSRRRSKEIHEEIENVC